MVWNRQGTLEPTRYRIDRPDCLVLGHAFEERIPVLWLLADVVDRVRCAPLIFGISRSVGK